METKDAIASLTALGHATRLAAYRLLVEAGPAGRMAGDIGEALGVPGATLSFHLKELVHAGLVEGDSQGRYVCYRANFQAMNALIEYLTPNCCSGASNAECTQVNDPACGCWSGAVLLPTPRSPRHDNLAMTHNDLYLFTGNSARSVLAEATLRAWVGNRFKVFSAGSQPTGTVNPFALAQLQAEGISTAGLRSKSWDEFTTPEAPRMDLVVTVCDSAAAETCP